MKTVPCSYYRGLVVLGALVVVCAHDAYAAGTPAGTVITNQATLLYTVAAGPPETATSNNAAFTVAEVINASLVMQDIAPLAVTSPDTARALTALLTNTGNGSEAYRLTRNNAIAGDQFDPLNAAVGAIFLENGAQAGFQASGANADTLYTPGSNDPVLAADAGRVVYVVSDIPASLGVGHVGQVSLKADALTPGAAGAAPGTTLAGLGTGGGDAVVGGSRATATATGSYVASNLAVAVLKSVSRIQAPFGDDPSRIMPGTVLTYSVEVRVSGSGTATNLAFNDILPAETDFVPLSITVNGAARTDGLDSDNAEFDTATRTLNARFGDTVAPVTHSIEFRVTVK